MVKSNSRIHFGWFVALMCFLIQGAAFGIVTNTRGLFFSYMCQDMGVQLGVLTRCYLFSALFTVLGIPIASKAIPKVNLRLFLSFFGLLLATCMFLYGYCTKVYHVYALACIQGLCSAFLVCMTTNLMINNWFIKSKGLVLAICGAASSVFGAFFSIITSNMIAAHGWRYSFRVLGIIVFFVIVPATSAFAVFKPQMMGLHPYGWHEAAEAVEKHTDGAPERLEGISKKNAVRSIPFAFLMLGTITANLMAQVAQLFPGYGESVGMGKAAAYLTTIAMVTSLIYKIGLGEMSDITGVRKAMAAACTVGCIGGIILVVFGGTAGWGPYVGCGLIPTPMAVTLILVPLWNMELFGQKDYPALMSYLQITAYIAASFGVTLMGTIIDIGGYFAFRVTCLVLLVILFLSSELSFFFRKRMKNT